MSKRPHITETTRKNLTDAFWKLYQTKPIERISVKEITDMAGYNRGTFYLYFKDIYDVLDNVEKDVLEIMKGEIEKYRILFKESGKEPDIEEISLAAIEIFKTCDYKPLVLLGDKGDLRFENLFREMMYKDLIVKIDDSTEMDDCTKEYIIHFFISGVIGVLKKWYTDGMTISVEQHLSEICNVIYGKNTGKRNNYQYLITGKE